MLRKVKALHPAYRDDIDDLITYRPLPHQDLEQIDPFLFLNHHGLQTYAPHNQGLPFGPHPHRGFETVTFILQGDVAHRDSSGHESVITEGGVQWMTAGRGLVHSETSSAQFKTQGGPLEILQLWVNLPAKYKMTEPKYIGLQREQLTHVSLEGGNAHVVAGELGGRKGPISPLTDIELMTLQVSGRMHFDVAPTRNIFFYVIKGELNVNGVDIKERTLVEFANEGSELELNARMPTTALFGHALPLDEPMVAYGPFVMNTSEEIHQAIRDYQNGLFGDLG